MRYLWRIFFFIIVLGVIAIAVGIKPAQSEQYSLEGLTTHEVNVMGSFVTYSSIGDKSKQPIVFLHGTGGGFEENLYEEFQMFKVLATDYWIIAPDLPGFRRSDIPEKPWEVGDYVDFIQIFLSRLEIDDPIIIGQSTGGLIAIRYAIEYPETIKLLLLGNTPKALDDKEVVEFVSSNILGPYYQQIFSSNLPGILKQQAIRVLSVPESRLSEDLTRYKVMGKTLENLLTYTTDIGELLKMKTATIILWGTYDSEAPVYLGRKLDQIFPNSAIYEYPSGKKVMVERPEEVKTLIDDALRGFE